MTKLKAREALDAYYREADSWAGDRQDLLRASRRTAWIVAGIAAAVALSEAAALIVLMPLKTVVPYTLMVDRNTGYVQALKPLDAKTIAPDNALTQSFLVQYVIARESFDIDALQENYRKVALWSADKARSDYVTGMQVTNPGSPLARLPRTTVIETHVKSVSPLGGTSALVRFDTQRRDAGGRTLSVRSWVAIVRYRFSTEPLQQSDRFLNPLGFQVLRYRRDQEQTTPPESVVIAPTAATPTIDPALQSYAPSRPLPPNGSFVVPGQAGASPLPLHRKPPRARLQPEVQL